MRYLLLTLVLISTINAQTGSSYYYTQNEFNLTSPGSMKFGLYGYDNPALLSTLHQFDIYFAWADFEEGKSFDHWGIFSAIPNFGFAAVYKSLSKYSITDYKLSASAGSESFSIGFGYGWSKGDIEFFRRSDLFTIGTLIRPLKHFSLGLVGNLSTSRISEGVIDVGIRPFGNELITFFADYVFRENFPSKAVNWSAGTAIEPLPGIRFTGRYFENDFFNIGVQLSFGRAGLLSQAHFSEDSKHMNNIYGIRIGAYDRNPFSEIFSDNNYAEINLLGNVKYQKNIFFDYSNTLFNLISQLDAVIKDKTVAGVAINTSGMNINREMLWELRQKLNEIKSAGKHVVIFIDRVGIDDYHFASIADKVIMDPQGMVILEGYLSGRQFYKNTLEKIGIGITELRYYKYKSAVENFSREEMSEADREQREALINDYYTTAKNDICNSRNISESKFDDLVNNQTIFLPQEALKHNLIDSIGRWDKVKEMLTIIEGDEKNLVSGGSLEKFNLPKDNHWGKKPQIAVVYAIGVCAMDEGINARNLAKDIESIAENKNIKAVVLRVDSPGGDGLASDLVAEAIKKCRERKPVIVSQGYVAGSGGYWLSMYGDTILAAPSTITGSIGVIAFWYYNSGFADDLGVTTDYVKIGKHADLAFGMNIPLLGFTIPDRDLTDDEKEKAEKIVRDHYKEFVSKVSLGRNLSYNYVDSIGQGRIYSGIDGIEAGLVDLLGGLDNAINLAADKIGLEDGEYEITEYPSPKLFDLKLPLQSILGLQTEENKIIEFLKFRIKNNGYPMPLLPIDDFNEIP
jgi:protease-4